MKTKAFTLVELMIAVVILSILITLAIPTYMRMVERAKQREAVATLNTIYAAERVYRTERQIYVSDWAALNLDNPDIGQTDFSYAFVGAPGANVFTVRARRRTGPFANTGAITINQTGNLGFSYTP